MGTIYTCGATHTDHDNGTENQLLSNRIVRKLLIDDDAMTVRPFNDICPTKIFTASHETSTVSTANPNDPDIFSTNCSTMLVRKILCSDQALYVSL